MSQSKPTGSFEQLHFPKVDEGNLITEIEHLREILRNIRHRTEGKTWRMGSDIARMADEGLGNYD